MAKYNFYDYLNRGGPLPGDINKPADRNAAKWKYDVLDAQMVRFRENCFYGDIHVIHKPTGTMLAVFHFDYGMCKRFKKVEWPGGDRPDITPETLSVVVFISVENGTHLNMRKPRRETKDGKE